MLSHLMVLQWRERIQMVPDPADVGPVQVPVVLAVSLEPKRAVRLALLGQNVQHSVAQ